MKRSIITLLSAAALISVSARESINIGNTPWRFTKITGAENLLKYGNVAVNGNVVKYTINDGKRDTSVDVNGATTINAELTGEHPIGHIALIFNGDNVHGGTATCSLYDADNRLTSTRQINLADYFDYVRENDINSVGDTFGFVVKNVGTSFTIPADANARYAKVEITRLTDADGNDTKGALSELEPCTRGGTDTRQRA